MTTIELVTGRPAATRSTPQQALQLEALLAVRRALDANGWLGDWLPDRGAAGGYCGRFEGVVCDAEGFVTGLQFTDTGAPLGGTLPPGALLARLPRLRSVWLANTLLTGTLPTDWGQLSGLQDVRLGRNALRGSVPREWAGMTGLKKLLLL